MSGAEKIWTLRGDPDVGPQAVVQPAADVVARRPAAVDDLVMAAAAAEVARPTAPAGLLAVDVAVREPSRLTVAVDATGKAPQSPGLVVHEAVAGEEAAVGRDA